jgi:hypothetical protein
MQTSKVAKLPVKQKVPNQKRSKKNKSRSNGQTSKFGKRRTQSKRVKGGRIGNNKVDMYLIAYPNRRKHDRVMYYMQQSHEDQGDILNIDFVEDLMETMVKSDPPLIAYKKTMKLKEKRD